MFRQTFAQMIKKTFRPKSIATLTAVTSAGLAAYSLKSSSTHTLKTLKIDPERLREILKKESEDYDQVRKELKEMKILVPKEQIAQATEKMAKEIAEKFHGEKHLLVLTMLDGASYLATDLKRAMHRNDLIFKEDTIRITRYGYGLKGGEPVVERLPTPENAVGRKILIIEDLVEGGVTLEHAIRELVNLGVKREDIYTAVLFDKKEQRHQGYENVQPNFVGFTLFGEDGKKWLVGHGCDQRRFLRPTEHMYYFPIEAQERFGYR